MKYCVSSPEHKSQLFDLWCDVFKGIEEAELFFENMYCPENAFVALDDDKVVAGLHLLPCYMVGIGNCGYIFAAATKEEYRKNGIMKNLILFTYDESKERGLKGLTVVPANEKLYVTYSNYGFVKSHYVREVCLKYDELAGVYGKKDYTNITNKEKIGILRNVSLCNKNLTLLWNGNHIKYSKNCYEKFGDFIINEQGYAFVEWNNDTLFVKELVCKENEYSLISTILNKHKKKKVVFRLPVFSSVLCGLGDIKPLGMTLGIEADFEKEMPYFGLCLD